jgi:hypothetical protein
MTLVVVLVELVELAALSSDRKRFPKVAGFVDADKAWTRAVQDAVRLRVDIVVESFQLWHVDWFFETLERTDKFCALLPLFPNMKEVTESAGMYRLVTEQLRPDLDLDVRACLDLIVVVGDGSTCRTACLFAALWPRPCQVHSIDPNMRDDLLDAHKSPAICGVANVLTCHKQTVEDWLRDAWPAGPWTRIVAVAVHSHAALAVYVPELRQKTSDLVLATMPCCVPQTLSADECSDLGLTLVQEKVDWGVASDKRKLFVYVSK